MVVKAIPVSENQITVANKSGSFTKDYFNNQYMKQLLEKYGSPLYLNAVVEDGKIHVTGLARGTF